MVRGGGSQDDLVRLWIQSQIDIGLTSKEGLEYGFGGFRIRAHNIVGPNNWLLLRSCRGGRTVRFGVQLPNQILKLLQFVRRTRSKDGVPKCIHRNADIIRLVFELFQPEMRSCHRQNLFGANVL